ncbi:MAG: hypothetical protein JJU45_19305 [Acidimicrobiia bacterium]|nr:hypothetical protein [Acidimicrobiia bacterium]
MLSSMPLCFNVFGSLGTHPAFGSLIRRLIDADCDDVVDVQCEWAPQPRSDYLNDGSAFDALIRYRDLEGAECFVGVETKYTEGFSSKKYFRPEYAAVTEQSGWFIAGADEILKAAATNQLWRTTMLAAAMEFRGAGAGRVVVMSCADDEGAARCVEAVRAQLVEPGRLIHVTYEQLVDAARRTEDPDFDTWADRFALRYLDPDNVGGARRPSASGPRSGRRLEWPERTVQRVTGSEGLREVLSWGLAARLVRRHPDLRITEEHPGGGQYDCLAIRPRDDAEVPFDLIHLNRAGSGFVFRDGDWVWAWRDPWSEMILTSDYRLGVELLEHHAGLPRNQPTPAATPATLAYRFIAAVLQLNLGSSPAWEASQVDGDGTWSGLEVPAWDQASPFDVSWILYRGRQPVCSVVTDQGTVTTSDGHEVDLMSLYAVDRRITALLASVLGPLAP